MIYINKVFKNAINEINYLNNVLFNIQKNPNIILSDMFINGEDCLMTYLFKNNKKYGDIENVLNIYAFQDYLYKNLINLLQLNLFNYKFNYNKNIYPSLLIISNKIDLAGIDIYNKICYIYEDKAILKKQQNINDLNIQRTELEKEIEFYDLAEKNIFKLANSSFEYIKIALQSKKYKRKAIENYKNANEKLLNLEIDIGKLEDEIENIKKNNLSYIISKKKIAIFFRDKYKFKIDLPKTIKI